MSFRSQMILALCAGALALSETWRMSLVFYITLYFYRSGGNGVVAREKLSDCGIGEFRA